jgi:hypothetical protein
MKIITYLQENFELDDGFGGQYQRVILAYLYACFNKRKFLRSKLFFNKRNVNLFYVNKFTKIFNFIGKQKELDINKSNKKFHNNEFPKNKNKILNISFKKSQLFLRKVTIAENKKIFLNFRKKFWKFNNIFRTQDTHIVIHIRNFRKKYDTIYGIESITYQLYDTDYKLPTYNKIFFNKWYISLVKEIIKKNNLKYKKFKIILCSVGKPECFIDLINGLKSLGKVELCLNKDDFSTFMLMINAKYLILAHSSFSYLASLINNGEKYIRNQFRHPLPFDVKIIKDYKLLKINYLSYLYFEFLKNFLKLRIKIKLIKSKF